MPVIPEIKFDIFAIIGFLGAIQGIFISFFYILKNKQCLASNYYFGILLIVLSILGIDVLLCYTNLMFRCIWFNDSTEPLNLLFGPLAYLFYKSKVEGKNPAKWYLHFIPSIIYLVNFLPYYFEGDAVKYNGLISAYHPELPFLKAEWKYFNDFLYLKKTINETTILSLLTYMILIIKDTINTRKNGLTEKIALINKNKYEIYSFYLIVISIILIKLFFQRDFGDYLIITVISLCIYLYSVLILRESNYLLKNEPEIKYQKSALSDELKEQIQKKITEIMEQEEYFLNPGANLPELSKKAGNTVNYVSQVINECMGKTFFELLADYRVKKAVEIIKNEPGKYTVETMAYMCGYNSKSAFINVFKKITGMTPTEFKKSGSDL